MKTKVLFLIAISISLSVSAQIIHIPANYLTIQEGINVATSGDTVLVDEGTYSENINFLGKAITVASQFIIDGDTNHINNTVIDGSQPNDPDMASVVSFSTGEDTTSIICGFTITNGEGNYFPAYGMRFGGGIFCYEAGATILNNKITGNNITTTGFAIGGGVWSGNEGGEYWMVIENNTISYNTLNATDFEAHGAGIFLETNARVKNNIIEFNEAYSEFSIASGGGFWCRNIGNWTNSIYFSDNVVRDNSVHGNETPSQIGAFGAGLVIQSKSTISDNIIQNNNLTSTFWAGAGLFIQYTDERVDIVDNLIINNSGPINANAGAGGGICLWDVNETEINVSGNIFINNTAKHGGGFYELNSYNVKLTNNVFSENNTYIGGAIGLFHPASNKKSVLLDSFVPRIINNTFFGNTATNHAGAIRFNGVQFAPIIFNCIFWQNDAPTGKDIYNASSEEITISYSNIDDNYIVGSWDGIENINEDPMLVDPENDNFHIESESPCAGTGTDSLEVNETMFYCPSFDFENEPRPMPYTYHPDMGADEVDEINPSSPDIVFPVNYSRLSNYPNPFNNQTTIEFEVQQMNFVKLSIVDFTGKEIQTLISEQIQKGTHQLDWNAEGLPAGVYFLKLEMDRTVETNKLILMR